MFFESVSRWKEFFFLLFVCLRLKPAYRSFSDQKSYGNLSLDGETQWCQKYQMVLMDDRKQYNSVQCMLFQGTKV